MKSEDELNIGGGGGVCPGCYAEASIFQMVNLR